MTLLVAGGSGALGRCVVDEATGRGFDVRVLVHRTSLHPSGGGIDVRKADARDGAQLIGVFDGVEAVVSALGASVLPDFRKGRRSYFAVDVAGNRNLIEAAKAAGVRRFLYVSVAGHESLAGLAYVQAHERVVATLVASGLEHVVVRPTGFFSAFGEMLPMARRGFIPLIGDGSAKTNPIHEADVASVCLDALDGDHEEIEAGGPETLTRREIMEEAFRAVGKPAKSLALPPAVARWMAYPIYPINPRMAQLIQFVTAVSIQDVVAPALGTLRLRDYFVERASRQFVSEPLA